MLANQRGTKVGGEKGRELEAREAVPPPPAHRRVRLSARPPALPARARPAASPLTSGRWCWKGRVAPLGVGADAASLGLEGSSGVEGCAGDVGVRTGALPGGWGGEGGGGGSGWGGGVIRERGEGG